MKKILFYCFLICFCSVSNRIYSQNDNGYFNSLALGLNAGSEGIGFDLATPMGNHFALRAGATFMPNISIKTDVNAEITGYTGNEEMELKGGLKRSSGKLLVNYYPVKDLGVFLCGGLFFGGEKLTDIHGHSDKFKEIVSKGEDVTIGVGDKLIPVDREGNIEASLEVAKVRPYIGIGFGQAVPKKRVGFMVELGVQIHGTPDICSDSAFKGEPTFDTDDSFSKIIDKLKVYPTLRLRFSGKIF